MQAWVGGVACLVLLMQLDHAGLLLCEPSLYFLLSLPWSFRPDASVTCSFLGALLSACKLPPLALPVSGGLLSHVPQALKVIGCTETRGSVLVWPCAGPQPSAAAAGLPPCPEASDITSLAMSSTGLLVGATQHGTLAVWSPSRCPHRLCQPDGAVSGMCY